MVVVGSEYLVSDTRGRRGCYVSEFLVGAAASNARMSCSRPHYRFPAYTYRARTRRHSTARNAAAFTPRTAAFVVSDASHRRYGPASAATKASRPVSDIMIPATRSEHMCERAARACARSSSGLQAGPCHPPQPQHTRWKFRRAPPTLPSILRLQYGVASSHQHRANRFGACPIPPAVVIVVVSSE